MNIMNINTNTLLNAMLTKIDPTIKSKIEKLSVDGKVDLSLLVKDKGIQTLLADMLKDIATGIKTKNDVASIVENGKNSLKFHNISTDIKQILNALKTQLPQTPQLEKLTILLKNTLVDINTINQKVVKSSFENSGVFLESKLGQSNFSIKDNLTKIVTLLNEKLTILNNIIKEPVMQEKKQLQLSALLLNINKTVSLIKEQLSNINLPNLTEVKNEIQHTETKLQSFSHEKNQEVKITVLKELITQNTRLLDKINTLNIQELYKNNIGNNKNILGDLKTILLQIKEQIDSPGMQENVSKELKTNIDKALSQIDYYQLSSLSSNSNHSFISFLQDELEDVDLKFNNLNEDEFSCLIHLTLKENGELRILLVLDKKSGLNISIGVQKSEFKSAIQTQLHNLRKQINSIGLSLLSLNLFDIEEETKKSNNLKTYSNNQNIDFGLDIKV